MTEGQDAAAAGLPPGGAGQSGPAAAGWSLFAEVAMPAPVPASPPGVSAGTPAPGGTGWPEGSPSAAGQARDPGPERGQGTQAGPAGAGMPSAAGAPGSGVASGPAGGERGPAGAPPGPAAPPLRPSAASSIWTRPAGTARSDEPDDDVPFARVDARKLEAALLGLRHPVVSVPLLLEAPGVTEARAERLKLLSQIDDYLLPRLRQSGAPILVALVGSTGAGKSTLMNSVVGKQVSATGIRRPTTNSPVLACHPDDMRWFAENVFLPTLPRVRQQGLAMPGRDGLLVLAASEGMPKGVAVLDTPDIDSVVQAHHDFAHQFLDASDLWLFVTTARRYADAAVWEMLKDARDRGAALAIALSRVPPASGTELASHFDAMLEANGLGHVRRFIIPETVITDAQLPAAIAAPVKDWLGDTARREDRRVAVLTQTMSGVLDTFRSRVPALAAQVGEQLALRDQLRATVDGAFAGSAADFDEATGDGSLLRGEVLARWQDFAGTGDLLRTLQVRRGRGRQKKQQMPARAGALKSALATSAVSLVTATADRAAELVVSQWQQQPAGSGLLKDLATGTGPGDRRGAATEADFVATALADLGLVSRADADTGQHDAAALARATDGLAAAAERVVGAWQAYVLQLVTEEKVTKRSIARVVSFDEESLALVLSIGALGYAAAGGPEAVSAVPQRLLESLFGAGLLRDMGARVRRDLHERVSGLLEGEARRFYAAIDTAGVPEDGASDELLQAGRALEEAR